MNKDVNSALYDFLKENETGLYTKDFDKDKTIYAYVHIDFYSIRNFVEIVGSGCFDDGGMGVTMTATTVVVELNDIFEGDDHYLSAYKKCFDEDDWKHYSDKIKEMEDSYA